MGGNTSESVSDADRDDQAIKGCDHEKLPSGGAI
jgi:hypothetical protein